MPRRPELDRPSPVEISLPESVRVRLDLHLFSDLEGRVPQGAYKRFFVERLREFFEWKRLDLGEGVFVAGPPAAIARIERLLRLETDVEGILKDPV